MRAAFSISAAAGLVGRTPDPTAATGPGFAAGSGTGIDTLLLVLVNLMWGGSYVASKLALVELRPMALAFLRFAIAGLVLLPFLLIRYGPRQRLSRSDLLLCVALGFVGAALALTLENVGLRYTQATHAALLLACEPIAIVILASMMLRDRPNAAGVTGAALALLGLCVLTVLPAVIGRSGSDPGKGAAYSLWGDFMVLLATVCAALFTIMGRNIVRRVPGLVVTTYAFVAGMLFLAPAAILEGGLADVVSLSPTGWTCLLYTAILGTSLPWVVWYRLLRVLSAPYIGAFLVLQPICGMLLGNLVLHEPLTLWTAGGGLLILGGLYLVSVDGIRELSLRDPATGLRSRRFVSEMVARWESSRPRSEGEQRRQARPSSVAMTMVEIDDLTALRAAHGRQATETLLSSCLLVLERGLRKDDVIARWGSEQLLVLGLLPDGALLAPFVARIREAISARPLDLGSGKAVAVGCSIAAIPFPLGGSPSTPGGLRWEDALALVELGMQRARELGGNRTLSMKMGAMRPSRAQLPVLLSDLALAEACGLVTVSCAVASSPAAAR